MQESFCQTGYLPLPLQRFSMQDMERSVEFNLQISCHNLEPLNAHQ